MSASEAAKHRQVVAEQPADVDPTTVKAGGLSAVVTERRRRDEVRGGVIMAIGGHLYWVRDEDAGIRSYRSKKVNKSWVGYLGVLVTDYFTGGVLLPVMFRADQNESQVFPDVLRRTCDVLQGRPLFMSADRGPANRENYKACVDLDITPVMPYRRANGSSPLHMPQGPLGETGFPRWDDEGNPICQHCGSPTERKGYSQGRILYRCVAQTTTACEPVKRIMCSRDELALIPQSRTSPSYIAMSLNHSPSERNHGAWRKRYKVLGKTLDSRPRQLGLRWQRLRAAAAWLIEWLWLAKRLKDIRQTTAPKKHTPERLNAAHDKHQARLEHRRAEERKRKAGKDAPQEAGEPPPG